jgi:hypothetical protein
MLEKDTYMIVGLIVWSIAVVLVFIDMWKLAI